MMCRLIAVFPDRQTVAELIFCVIQPRPGAPLRNARDQE